jgi:DNA-directed RNA polymerase specialized sigma24 family protein
LTTPRITLEVELTREGLAGARDAIDDLLADLGLPEQPIHPWAGKLKRSSAQRDQAQRKVDEVWARVGDNARRFLAVAAQAYGDGDEFTMDEIARHLDRSAKTVRSWHRNLGRTLSKVDETMPEPELMPKRWNGTQNVYRLTPEVRQAILKHDMPGGPA